MPRDGRADERGVEPGILRGDDGIGADQILLLRQRQRTKKRRDVQFGHTLVLRALFNKDLFLRKKRADALACPLRTPLSYSISSCARRLTISRTGRVTP